MCGIAGFIDTSVPSSVAVSLLAKMNEAIAHRGPDDYGFRVLGPAGLGMRRLSIIDVAHGQQPISNETDDVFVVFNGEIYNHHALRDDLKQRGHHFTTGSDTEVLVHLYEEYGPAMVSLLNGMFAFAIWDARIERLFAARDRFGMKPLCYRITANGLQFFSDLRSLCAVSPTVPEVSSEAISRFITFGYVPDPHTVFSGVQKLPPACTLSWTRDSGVSIGRYWTPPPPNSVAVSEPDLIEQLRLLLRVAVRRHLESEVPLGAFLSGGIDSATVVAIMAGEASGRVKTFSIGFTEDGFNEAPAARASALALGTDHHELIVKPDVASLLDDMVTIFDEPFADSSAIPTFLVSRLAREHVTVALSGDAGDELFGGYTRYQQTLSSSGAPAGLRRLLRLLGRSLPHSIPGRNRLIDLGRSLEGRYANQMALSPLVVEGGVLRPDLGRELGPLDGLMEPIFRSMHRSDPATRLMLADLAMYLPGDILTKVDRATMAVSLEARVPFLDVELADFALSLPAEWKIRNGQSKYLLRQAIRGLVPDSVLHGPKRGFAIPIGEWLRGPLAHYLDEVAAGRGPAAPYLHAPAVHRIVAEHRKGRRDHGGTIWRIVVLDRWLRALADGVFSRPPRLWAESRRVT